MTVVYLAGPMKGYPELNFPAFHKAAAYLRSFGYVVISPAETELTSDFNKTATNEQTKERRFVFELDTQIICQEAEAIAMLPGWENSSGAFAEWALARTLGLKMMYLRQEEYDR